MSWESLQRTSNLFGDFATVLAIEALAAHRAAKIRGEKSLGGGNQVFFEELNEALVPRSVADNLASMRNLIIGTPLV